MKRLEEIKNKIYNILHSEEFKEKHRMQEKDFTRKRKLGFAEVSTMVLKGMKRGVRAGISEFLEGTKNEVEEYSNAAFCKARQRIGPSAFEELFRTTATSFYDGSEYKTYNGYRICAIDGSDINLPNTKELLEIYGSEPYSNGRTQVQSLVSCLYDVLNHVIIDASMNHYQSNERKIAVEHLSKLDEIRTEKELLIMDRGYPSEELMKGIEDKGFKYLMRVNKDNFFREIRKAKTDCALCRETENGSLYYRLVLITLKNGTTEALITNLEEDFSKEMLMNLYQLRWGIETKYDDLKNKLQIENFSGIDPVCILQDFYSTLFLSNILAYIEADCSEELKKINSSEQYKYKYKYKINTNNAIFVLKQSVVKMLLSDSPKEQKKLFTKIEHDLLQCLSPIRKDRSFPRAAKHKALKFSFNRKCH